MKKIAWFSCLWVALVSSGQVRDGFSDGDFTRNPAWTGTTEQFVVNDAFRLQSAASVASKSFLFTPSEAFDDAVWECWMRVEYPLSQFNYACLYLASDRNDDIAECNAYYVRVGGVKDAVSLFVQQGEDRKEIIKGAAGRFGDDLTEVRVRVTRDAEGNFALYSRRPEEDGFVLEGRVNDMSVRRAHYVGLMYSNSGKTGRCYYFDDVSVSGKAVEDTDDPEWVSVETDETGRLRLVFSEPMDFSDAVFEVDNGVGVPVGMSVSADACSVVLEFPVSFEPGVVYTLKTEHLTDKAGHALPVETQVFGIAEPAVPGDVLINEVMFNQPEGSFEYIELVNVSEKLVDASRFSFTTRKADGSLNAGRSLERPCLLEPGGYVAVTEDAEVVRRYHACPPESRIVSMKWTALNNEEATLLLMDKGDGTVYDELAYRASWHHPLIRNEKGVALERISTDFITQNPDTWHSASSETNYGTPGYRNSQSRDVVEADGDEGLVWLEPEAFSPDNDGFEDVCLVRYRMDGPGYAANVMLFDAAGVEVRRLASGDLLAVEGVYVWDGTLTGGTAANIGVYVLYFELYHPQRGIRKVVKRPVVVSAR